MSLVTPHQTDLTTFCKFKREQKLRRALHLSLNLIFCDLLRCAVRIACG